MLIKQLSQFIPGGRSASGGTSYLDEMPSLFLLRLFEDGLLFAAETQTISRKTSARRFIVMDLSNGSKWKRFGYFD